MLPVDIVQSEYSYHSLDAINQNLSGNSHWSLPKSLDRTSEAKNTKSYGPARKKRRLNNKKIISFNDNDIEEEMPNVFLPYKWKVTQNRKRKCRDLYRRFDSRKLILPTDHHIPKDLFDYHYFSPSLDITAFRIINKSINSDGSLSASCNSLVSS